MALASALFSSVSGLDTASTAITVAGDNIANVNTPGFKERRAEFADVLGQSISSVGGFAQLGAGSTVQRVSQIFTQGTFETTGRGTDLAIEGPGFFVVDDAQGRFYTRAGLFTVDQDGTLVNSENMRVQGFATDPATGLSTGQLGDLQINAALSPPQASTSMEISAQLDASEAAIPGGFDPADPNGTSHFRTVITLYDTQGNGHPASVFYTKTGANTWDVNVGLAPADTSLANPGGDPFVLQNGAPITLTFDNNGALVSPATATNVDFAFAGLQGNPTQSIALAFGNQGGANVDPTTQFASSSATGAFLQDGFSPGTVQGVSIDLSGLITGQFSNGETLTLGQLALASFPNVEELTATGRNRFTESRASGQALIGEPGTGRLGSIRSNTIEQSNVDLAAQFVKLIINQRAFQANTRTISVTNELLANLNALGQ